MLSFYQENGKPALKTMYRKKLLSAITKTREAETRLIGERLPKKLAIFLFPFAHMTLGAIFVLLSLPSFLTKTQCQDFQKTARVDEDGAILDSYANFVGYYRAGVAICVIALSLISFVVIDLVSID